MINEEKLIKKVRAGDDQALEKLFHLYEPLVNSIVKQVYIKLNCLIMHGPWYVTIWHVAGKSIVNRSR